MSDYLHDLFGLADKAAVVIGGTGVLCGRMAQALANAGARVILAGRDETKAMPRIREIDEVGGRASFLPVDVASRDSIHRLFDAARKELGPIHILINGAGINSATPYLQITDEDWDRVLAINLRGVHQACQIFGKHMVENEGGSIINVASVSALTPLSRVFAYSASKSAVINYSMNLARELGATGVRVNVISPGFFPAEQNRDILDRDRVERVMGRTPMARFGQPPELDGVVLLLASERAGGFITGANFVVDGGFSAMAI